MSKLLKPRESPKNRKLDWINTIASIHNLVCGCNEPLDHTVQEIFEQEPTIQKKCTTITPTDHGNDDDELGDDAIAALFEEGFGEEKDTGNAG